MSDYENTTRIDCEALQYSDDRQIDRSETALICITPFNVLIEDVLRHIISFLEDYRTFRSMLLTCTSMQNALSRQDNLPMVRHLREEETLLMARQSVAGALLLDIRSDWNGGVRRRLELIEQLLNISFTEEEIETAEYDGRHYPHMSAYSPHEGREVNLYGPCTLEQIQHCGIVERGHIHCPSTCIDDFEQRLYQTRGYPNTWDHDLEEPLSDSLVESFEELYY